MQSLRKFSYFKKKCLSLSTYDMQKRFVDVNIKPIEALCYWEVTKLWVVPEDNRIKVRSVMRATALKPADVTHIMVH